MVVTMITIWLSVVSVCCGDFWLTTLVLPSLVGIQVVALWWCAHLDRAIHFHVRSAGSIGFDFRNFATKLSFISILMGQSHVHGGTNVALDLSSRVGFRGGRFLDMRESLRLSSSSQVDMDEGCCGVFQWVEFGTDFFLNAFGRPFHVGSVVMLMGMGIGNGVTSRSNS